MNYTTYWSVLDSPAYNVTSNSVLLFVAIGAGIIWILTKTSKKDEGDGDRAILRWGAGIFAVLAIGMYIIMTFIYQDNTESTTLKMLNSPKTPRVEGVIKDFKRCIRKTRYNTETTETFIVDSIRFTYCDAAIAKFGCFSQTYNNIIFDGQRVRITYRLGSQFDSNFNTILKLEIAQ